MSFFMVIIGFSTLGLVILLGVYLVKLGKLDIPKRYTRSPKTYARTTLHPTYHSQNSIDFYGNNPDEVLPNGWRRKDYYEYGLTDNDLEFWGLDLPGAPEPALSGIVIMDVADGDFNGSIDLW